MQCAKGRLVEVQTVWGEKVEGRTFASYTSNSPILALQTSGEPQQSFRIFSKDALLSLRELDDLAPKLVSLPQFVPEEAVKREREAKAKALIASKKIGRGVTKDGQLVFNAIENILPQTQWSDQSIIVMNDIIIDPPYRVENCRTKSSKPSDSKNLLRMVKQIIEKMPKS